ncbi:MAG TPA: tripartite tricarboxylate transporter substrate binding protein [Burkholderiales bacterium]|nr:tripartite tricarboxylate transporter substrate binding protein [Burkholderiales bacterium]
MSKSHFVRASVIGTVACLTLTSGAIAQAQDYPGKPVRIIVPSAPGSGLDTVMRLVGQRLGERWTVQVVVDNRPGAGTTLGTDMVAKAPSDGYTLLGTYGAMAANSSMYTRLPYDAIADFAPISLVNTAANLIVANASLPANGLKELSALAKAQPGALTYGSGGYGATQHLTMELLALKMGVKLNHVPYKGAAPAMVDAMAGNIALAISTTGSSAEHVRAKRLKALAVTSAKRNAALPQVPTAIEQGLSDFEAVDWFGILGPRKIPDAAAKKVAGDVGAVMKDKAVQERFLQLGYDPVGSSPQEFDAFFRRDVARWGRVVADAKLRRLEN